METDDDIKISARIKRELTRYAAPDMLRQNILKDLATHNPGREPGHDLGSDMASNLHHPVISWHQRLKNWFLSPGKKWVLLPTGFTAGVLATFMGVHLFMLTPQDALIRDALPQEITGSHVRSLMAAHLSDVASGDKHTVKPWFVGKLDYAPPVNDFAAQGFALQGGRIDYLDQRAVAALVYKRREHVINSFVWPDAQADTSPQPYARKGFNLLRWRSGGMVYWLVSDISADELLEFAKIIRAYKSVSK